MHDVERKIPPAIGFVGWSGSGKTSLLERLLPVLRGMGLTTGYLKSSCGFQIDHPGKDSDRLFTAGAERVLIASADEAALRFRPRCQDVLSLLQTYLSECDMVVVEGFRDADLPKIEVFCGRAFLAEGDPKLVALVSDVPDPRPVPRFGSKDLDAIARFAVKTAIGTTSGSSIETGEGFSRSSTASH